MSLLKLLSSSAGSSPDLPKQIVSSVYRMKKKKTWYWSPKPHWEESDNAGSAMSCIDSIIIAILLLWHLPLSLSYRCGTKGEDPRARRKTNIR